MQRFSSFDWEITRRCNLACPYCYLGQKPTDSTVSRDTIDQTVAFIVQNREPEKRTTINLYGGEPLLAWAELTYAVESIEAAKIPCRFVILSNGTIASQEIGDYLKAHKISIARSIDGCPDALDLNRPGILDKYKAAGEIYHDHNRTRRCTVSPGAAKYLLKSLRFLHDELGITKGGCWMPDFYAEWSEQHAQDFINQLWEVGKEYVADYKAGKRWPYHWIDRAKPSLEIQQPKKRRLGCGAGRGLIAISWDGYVFPCHRFCTEPHDGPFCGGHVSDVMLRESCFGQEWENYQNFTKEDQYPSSCEGCTAQAQCGFGCCHVNLKVSGTLLVQEPLWCRFRRASVEVVRWIDSQLRPINPAWYVAKKVEKTASPTKKKSSATKSTPPTHKQKVTA